MKLRTRLRITFATIAILPVCLLACAFLIIGNIMIYLRQADGVERVVNLMPRGVFIAFSLAALIIMLTIATVLTRWIARGVFNPINDLKNGMQQIADGNFDYVLDSEAKGEIGELYQNYEDMRLRLKESTEAAIQNEAKNRELVTNISHDLKTPITAIKGYVEGIMDGVCNTPEKMYKYIKTIYNKSNDMDRLINELTI